MNGKLHNKPAVLLVSGDDVVGARSMHVVEVVFKGHGAAVGHARLGYTAPRLTKKTVMMFPK